MPLHVSATEEVVVKELRRMRKKLAEWFPSSEDGNSGILLLGEADFSFSLAAALRGVPGLTATAYESEEDIRGKYALASAHISSLKRLGVDLAFGVDATRLHESDVADMKFQRIVFNFPHTGVPNYQRESVASNQALLRGVLQSTAGALARDGELRLSLRSDPVYHAWRVLEQAEAAFRDAKAQGLKRGLSPVAREAFPYHLFFGYRHAATVQDRAVDNPDAHVWVFRLKKAWDPPPDLLRAASADVEWSRGEYMCSICNITFRAKKQLEMHEAGRKHKESLAASRANVGKLKKSTVFKPGKGGKKGK